MEEEARLQEQINEEVASLAIENEQKASDQQSAADMEKPGQPPFSRQAVWRKPSPFTRRRSRCTKALAWDESCGRNRAEDCCRTGRHGSGRGVCGEERVRGKAEKREAAREAIRQKEEMEEAVMEAAKEAAKEAVEEAMETETETETQQ